jgi:hypothetical protein
MCISWCHFGSAWQHVVIIRAGLRPWFVWSYKFSSVSTVFAASPGWLVNPKVSSVLPLNYSFHWQSRIACCCMPVLLECKIEQKRSVSRGVILFSFPCASAVLFASDIFGSECNVHCCICSFCLHPTCPELPSIESP